MVDYFDREVFAHVNTLAHCKNIRSGYSYPNEQTDPPLNWTNQPRAWLPALIYFRCILCLGGY